VTSAAGVDAGLFHSCARRTDGRILCWGDNSAGQLGNGSFLGFTPPGLTAPVTTTINPVQASGITSATDIGTGFYFSCARLSDSTVRCWGDNSLGTLGNGTGISFMTPVQVTK
jgi:alpha-tubulin suppressor-like RCC1 family protein